MALLPGVYMAKKKSGELYFRSAITWKSQKISLGSYQTEREAHLSYLEAKLLLSASRLTLDSYEKEPRSLSFSKWVTLTNYRDNGIYIKTPIYLRNRYFVYYLEKEHSLFFDVDDLFYYSNHKIMKRGGHLFVADFGMQINILSRYGIKNFAVPGKDYRFVNGNPCDFRYGNIEIVNRYHGVSRVAAAGRKPVYVSRIHVKGNYIIGRYSSETEAAVAYNKAAWLLKSRGFKKNFPFNYIDSLSEQDYQKLFDRVPVSRALKTLSNPAFQDF